MIRIIVLLTAAIVICYGRPPGENSLHVVYSKMLSEVGPSQAEPRSGVAYVYSITASESPSPNEGFFRSSDVLLPQEFDIRGTSKEVAASPKVLSFKNNLSSPKEIKEKTIPFLSIDPLDPKANESGIS